MKKFFILTVFVFAFLYNCKSQTYPKYIKPGKTFEVVATDDTLWVLTDAMVRKALKTDMENEILNEQVLTMNQEIEILKLQGQKKDTLITILETDRDYYKKIWTDCSSDVDELGKISMRKGKMTRIAIFTGAITTVAAFFFGGYILP